KAVGNGRGVFLDSNATLGGTTAGARNVVSGNVGDGVFAAGGHNVIEGNYIGTDRTGTKALGNTTGGGGVYVAGGNGDLIGGPEWRGGGSGTGASNNTLGGTAAGARNVIADNRASGVAIGQNAGEPSTSGNSILGNSIRNTEQNSGYGSGLGIDIFRPGGSF